jgi:type IV pilus assembly protein PilA
MNNSKGFTLVELMAVVAIVSVLATVALSAYTDYVIRSKVSEGMSFMAEAKTSVSEYYYTNKILPTSNNQAGLPTVEDYSKHDYIRRLELTTAAPGVITVTFKLVGTSSDGKELQLTPLTRGGLINWECLPPEDNGISRNRVPPNCRG